MRLKNFYLQTIFMLLNNIFKGIGGAKSNEVKSMVDGFMTIALLRTLTYRCPFSVIRAVAESVDRVGLDPLT